MIILLYRIIKNDNVKKREIIDYSERIESVSLKRQHYFIVFLSLKMIHQK